MSEQDEQGKDRIVARGEISSELDIVPVAHRNGALQVCYRSKILPITPLRCVHPVSSHWQNLMNLYAPMPPKLRPGRTVTVTVAIFGSVQTRDK